FEQRMQGRREPGFDPRKADPGRVKYVKMDRTQRKHLLAAALAFQQADAVKEVWRSGRVRSVVAGIVIALVLCLVTFALSDLPYKTPHSPQPELVVSFSHGGAIREPKKLSAEELAKRLPHMRAQVNVSRERVPVRLRITVDGQVVYQESFAPKGFSRDGPSIAVARLRVSEGLHQVQVEIADTAEENDWTRRWSGKMHFEANRARVVLFDTKAGFSLH
ncbi:MAG: hypothetical protein ACXW32_04310, partial [Limisphaerales bacterium]